MQEFRDIKVWQRTHRIVLGVYALTASFPAEERFGITQQLRRAVVSVPTNIAEGSKRLFRRDYVRFLNIAEASLREVEYLLVLSRDLRFGDRALTADLLAQTDVAARMLATFRKAVQRADRRKPRPVAPDARPQTKLLTPNS